MKRLLENKVVLTHITTFAGPASCLPMYYAFQISIPEFGYSYLERRFYLPMTDGKSLLTYDDVFIRYPVRSNGSYKNKEGVEEREYVDGEDIVTLKYVGWSPSAMIMSCESSEDEFSISHMGDGSEEDPIASIVNPPPQSRIIDSHTILHNPSKDIEYATHFIYAKIISVRNILDLFRREMKCEFHEEDNPIYADSDVCICDGKEIVDCHACQYARKEEKTRLERKNYESNIINYNMRYEIISSMYSAGTFTSAFSGNGKYSMEINRSAKLRYWYWRISSCTEELLIGMNNKASYDGVGYMDNDGVVPLDELLWKMDLKEDLKALIRLRRAFREAKKSEDTLVVEFLECNEKCAGRLEQWWLLYSGVESPEDIVPHSLSSVTQAMGYDMYEEARILLTRFNRLRLGDAAAIRQYVDLCERLEVNAGVFTYK